MRDESDDPLDPEGADRIGTGAGAGRGAVGAIVCPRKSCDLPARIGTASNRGAGLENVLNPPRSPRSMKPGRVISPLR